MNNRRKTIIKRAALCCSFYFILISFFSCSSSPDKVIQTGPAFYILPSDNIHELDIFAPLTIHYFKPLLYIAQSDLALNKVVVMQNDTFYFSISTGNGPALRDKFVKDSSYTILSQNKQWMLETSVSALLCKKSDFYLTRYFIPDNPTQSMLVVDRLVRDSVSAFRNFSTIPGIIKLINRNN